MRRACLLLVLTAAGVVTAAPLAAAAPAWLPEDQPSGAPAAEAFDARVALAARGDAAAVWVSFDDAEDQRVAASLRTVTSLAWAPDEFISPPGLRAITPRVAMGPSGDAVAVWRAGTAVQASVRPAGAPSWGPPQTLSSADGGDSPRIAVAPSGATIAVWRGVEGDLPRIQAAVRPAGGDAFGPARPLSAPGEATSEPELAAGAAGAVAVWLRGEEPGASVRAAALPAGAAAWSAPRTVSAPSAALAGPRVAVNDAGVALAAWLGRSGGVGRVQAASGAVGGDAWAPPLDVSPAVAGAADVDVGIGEDGAAVAVWSLPVAGVRRIHAAQRPPGAGWGAPEPISAPGLQASDPALGTNAAGAAVVAWRSVAATPGLEVYAAARAPGRGWDPAVLLGEDADSGVNADVSLDAAGNAVTVWEDGVIRARAYDAAGPVLAPVVPAVAAPGQALAFSVSARDLWSLRSGAPVWSFGDGGPPREGGAVTHAYAAPGRYRVTVTASDVLGNVSTAERTVVVSAPAPVTGGAAPGAGPRAGAGTAGTRRAVRAAVTAGVRRLPGGRLRLVARGYLAPVAGARLGAACRGRVVVEVRAGRRLLASGATGLVLRRGRCVYRRAVVLRAPRGARRVSVRVTYAGGARLAPARSRAVTVRLP